MQGLKERDLYTLLSDERRCMLEAVGFDFEPRQHHAPYGSKRKEASAKHATEAEELEEDSDDEDSDG